MVPGADHPDSSFQDLPVNYVAFAGSLFGPQGPSYTDVHQGGVGDCYLLAAFGALASSNPSAIENMFHDNGDGTWTVRFYADGTPDYVTVDRDLPYQGNEPFYAGVGGTISSGTNVLWVALAEKAYAEWAETGKEAAVPYTDNTEMRDGTNSYAGLGGGYTGAVFQQILGVNSSVNAGMPDPTEQQLIEALAAHEAVACATSGFAPDLISGHEYVIIGYDAANDTFLLSNPYGVDVDPPPPLSFAKLRFNGDSFDLANTTVTTAFG